MINSFPKFFFLALFVQISLAKEIPNFISDVAPLREYSLKDVHSGTPSGYYVIPLKYKLSVKDNKVIPRDHFYFQLREAFSISPDDVYGEPEVYYNDVIIAKCQPFSKKSDFRRTYIICLFNENITNFDHIEGSFNFVVSFEDGLVRDDFKSDRGWSVGANRISLQDFRGQPTYNSEVELTAVDPRGSDVLVRFLDERYYYFSIRSPEITCDAEYGNFFVTFDAGRLVKVGIFMFSSVSPFGRPTNADDIPSLKEFNEGVKYTVMFGKIPKGQRLFVYGELEYGKVLLSYGFDIRCSDALLEVRDQVKFGSFASIKAPEAKEFTKIPLTC